jgi:DNA invertase Pin-like site-specific DNA recombinase
MKKAISYIRFSSPEQKKGDSLRRQTEATERWCKENGYILDDSLTDEGLSAYHGVHKSKGDLGKFIEAIKKGKIEPGTVLIVEALDRLSRENPRKAFNAFDEILDYGINICTLMDGKLYTDKSVDENPFDLMSSLMRMIQANQESEYKSKRGKENWKNKRKIANSKILTKRCPLWLSAKEDRSGFIANEKAVESIKRIYELYLNGYGKEKIVNFMNQSDFWKPEKGWKKSYVKDILKSKAVIGEFQPSESYYNERGIRQRRPVGEPVKDYYPKIISEKIFYRVQSKFEQFKHFKGKTGKVSNIFTGLLKCGYCGRSFSYFNKGSHSYLACESARRKAGCKYLSIRYDKFQDCILNFCKELDTNSILNPDSDRNKQIENLQGILAKSKAELSDLKQQEGNLLEAISGAENPKVISTLSQKLEIVLEAQGPLESSISETEAKIQSLSVEKVQTEINLIETKDLIEQLEDESNIDLRLKVRDKLRSLIQAIIIKPVGQILLDENKVEKIVQWHEKQGYKHPEIIREHYSKFINNKNECLYGIVFKSDIVRQIKPSEKKVLAEIDFKTKEYYMNSDYYPINIELTNEILQSMND